MIQINESDIKKFYKLLAHEEETELRLLDPKKVNPPLSIFVHSEEEFVNECKKYNGRYNIYAGIQERKEGGTKSADVIGIKTIFLDIDAPRPDTKQPATTGELKVAEEITDNIIQSFKEAELPTPIKIFSGNGFQIAIPVPRLIINESNRKDVEEKMELFQERIKDRYDKNDAIDRIGDLPRIIKVTGSWNIKGDNSEERPHRLSKFISEPTNAEENEKILQYILDLEVEKINIPDIKPQEELEMDCMPQCIKYLFSEYVFTNPIGWMRTVETLSAFFRGIGFNQDKAEKLILEWNSRQGYHESGEQEDIKEITKRVYSNGIFVANCEKLRNKSEGFPRVGLKDVFKDKSLGECCGHYINPVVYYCAKLDDKVGVVSINDFLIIEYYEKGEKKGEEKGRVVNIDKVAEYIENKLDIRTIFGIREETIEDYNGGIWTTKGRGIIKAEIERLLGVYSKNNVVSEVLEKIKRRTEVSREETENIPNYKRCIENGVLDLEDVDNIKLLPPDKKFNFRTKFPMNYDLNAKCPKNLKFFEETFYPEDLPKFQEFLGLHLIRKYSFKKAAIFHGAKDTGKSVVLNLMTKFVGGNVSGLSLQDIARGKAFDLLALKDKDANICDDLSSADLASTGGFKMAIGDAWISGEAKFGDKCKFRNTAKDSNACNSIPAPKNDIDDEATYGRILLFPIDNVVPKERMNKDLIEELTTPEELSGLLNWAIEGYKRLVKQNCFTNDKTAEETKFLMIQNGNSLARFATEVLIPAEGEKIDKEIMYQIYCKWCLEHKPTLSPDTKDKIGKSLTRVAPYTQASSNGKERYWLNVKLNQKYDSYYTFSKNIRDITKEVKDTNSVSDNISYIISKPVIAVSNLNNFNKPKPDFEESDRDIHSDEDYSEDIT